MKMLVTGGAGFIGSAACRLLVGELNVAVLHVDELTYAANLVSLRTVETHPVVHLAAESDVDRSIEGHSQFIKTNVEGTFVLLRRRLVLAAASGQEGRKISFS